MTWKKKKRPSLEDILQHVKENAHPKSIKELGIRLNLEDAEELCSLLAVEGIEAEPYDFPGTKGVWREYDGLFCMKATKQLIVHLAEQERADYRTVEGFKRILPHLDCETCLRTPINQWGTTLRGMFSGIYGNSPSQPVLELVETDEDFLAIRTNDLRAYDFPKAPQNMWIDNDGAPTAVCRAATKELFSALACDSGIDPTTRGGFKIILPQLTERTFQTYPINVWATRLSGMLIKAYANSPGAAVLDVIHNDETFSALRDIELYDFPCAPNRTWVTKEGSPSDVSRRVTKQLILTMAEREKVDYHTVEGFRALLPTLTINTFYAPINDWGTTLQGMITNAYRGSPVDAVIDLVNNDDDFMAIRTAGIQPYDFLRVPNQFWVDEQGNPLPACIEATKRLVQYLAQTKHVDYRTFDGFRNILPLLTRDTFNHTPTNFWGTTLGGVMRAYNNSPSAAILALVAQDDEFKEVYDLQPYDFPWAPRHTWTDASGMPTDTARKATKLLVDWLAMETKANYADREGISPVLPLLTLRTFESVPINRWGTTLRGMLVRAYGESPAAAFFDLIDHDDDFKAIRGEITNSDIGRRRK